MITITDKGTTLRVLVSLDYIQQDGIRKPAVDRLIEKQAISFSVRGNELIVAAEGLNYAILYSDISFPVAASAAALLAAVQILQNNVGGGGGLSLIGQIIGANFNTTADQQIPLVGGSNGYYLSTIVIDNPSRNITAAKDARIYTGPNRTGTMLFVTNSDSEPSESPVPPADALQYLTDANNGVDQYLTNLKKLTSPLYFSLGTAQGVAATADVKLYGTIRP